MTQASDNTVRVIIAGSRTFDNYKLLEIKCDHYLQQLLEFGKEIEIVSGGQRTVDKDRGLVYGADYLGEVYAQTRGFKLKIFSADWEKHGKAAGPIRNRQMGDYADCAVIFWDGKTPGSKDMINVCVDKDLKYRVVNYSTL